MVIIELPFELADSETPASSSRTIMGIMDDVECEEQRNATAQEGGR